jgi:hypothetical protein
MDAKEVEMTIGRPRLRLATVVQAHCPAAAITRELTTALHVIAPEIAVTSCLIGVPSAPAADIFIAANDPTAYRRAAQRLAALGTDLALIQHRIGYPGGRHLLGLSDELGHRGIPYLVLLHDLPTNLRPLDADTVTALGREAAAVLVLSDAEARLLAHQRLIAPEAVAVLAERDADTGAGLGLGMGQSSLTASAAQLAGVVHLVVRRAVEREPVKARQGGRL